MIAQEPADGTVQSMRVFVYEYTCAHPASDGAAAALHAEGWAMLAAVCEDLARVSGVVPVTLLGAADPAPPGGRVVRCRPAEYEPEVFRRLAATADRTVVIA